MCAPQHTPRFQLPLIVQVSRARLDKDGSADLTVAELKEMRNTPDIQMPDASMAGMRLPYFRMSFVERLRTDVDAAEAFQTLDRDDNGVLTRTEASAAKQFFRTRQEELR